MDDMSAAEYRARAGAIVAFDAWYRTGSLADADALIRAMEEWKAAVAE